MVTEQTAAQPGDLARDLVTGFEGVIVTRSTWLHGCDRLTIQPNKLGSDDKPIGEETFDEDRIEIIQKGMVPSRIANRDHLYPIGAKAKDTVSGFDGIITGLAVGISGRVTVVIEPTKLDKDGKSFPCEAFDATRVEVIVEQPVPKTTATTSGKRGGPPPRGEASIKR